MADLMKILMLAPLLILAGCQQHHSDDLNVYVAKVEARKKPDIPPIPVMKPYQQFNYAAAELHDPFIPTVVDLPVQKSSPLPDNGIHPNKNRRKEALEAFGLAKLRFVGTLKQKYSWALIKTPDGVIHRVQVGNYLGRNNGRITSISDTKLMLKEIVQGSSGRYVERATSLLAVEVK